MKALFVAVILIGGVTCSASPLCTDIPALTLDMLLPGGALAGGCTIDNKLFDNFSYSIAAQGGGVTVPEAGSITVTPLVTPRNPGLRFTAFWAAGPGAFADSTLAYTVHALPGSSLIDDNSLLMVGGHTGTGIAAIDEVKCLGGTFANNCAQGALISLGTIHAAFATQLMDHVAFHPVFLIDVIKDIGVTGGVSGSATVSTIEQRYSSPIPEGASLLLVGSGLLLCATIVRRRRSGIGKP